MLLEAENLCKPAGICFELESEDTVNLAVKLRGIVLTSPRAETPVKFSKCHSEISQCH